MCENDNVKVDIQSEAKPKISEAPKPVNVEHGFIKAGEPKRSVIKPGKKINFYPLAEGGFIWITADNAKILAQFVKRHLVVKGGLATYKG